MPRLICGQHMAEGIVETTMYQTVVDEKCLVSGLNLTLDHRLGSLRLARQASPNPNGKWSLSLSYRVPQRERESNSLGMASEGC